MIRQVVSIAAILMVFGGAAHAQGVGVVLAGGDHGKLAALEVDAGGFVARAGVVGRANAMMDGHQWDGTAGVAWRFRGESPLSMDLGLDVESMAPGVMVDEMDVRARIGIGWAVNARAAVVVERSRSLHNGTNYGRWMLGGRVGF